MLNLPEQVAWRAHYRWRELRRTIFALALVAIAPFALAATAVQKSFVSPEAAITALVEAVRSNDQQELRAILGPYSSKLVSSGDAVADEQNREAFIKAYGEANQIVREREAQATLVIGKDEWPLPIPLVKSADGWRFDTRQGEKEILQRRIGRNELAVIQVCLAIVDAEHEYAAKDQDGILEYAPKFVSTPGKRNGLYWETKADEPPSPLGPLLAAAAKDGYASSTTTPLSPYHGYHYRILTKQGKLARGGAYDYIVKGRMIGGFAVIAYPTRYGASGIMSFIVNHDGVVYQKDLGKNTAAIAAKMTTFDPDPSWKQP